MKTHNLTCLELFLCCDGWLVARLLGSPCIFCFFTITKLGLFSNFKARPYYPSDYQTTHFSISNQYYTFSITELFLIPSHSKSVTSRAASPGLLVLLEQLYLNNFGLDVGELGATVKVLSATSLGPQHNTYRKCNNSCPISCYNLHIPISKKNTGR